MGFRHTHGTLPYMQTNTNAHKIKQMKTLLELAYMIMGFTRGKMAQLAESLPFESEDLSLILRTYVKRLGIVARA